MKNIYYFIKGIFVMTGSVYKDMFNEFVKLGKGKS